MALERFLENKSNRIEEDRIGSCRDRQRVHSIIVDGVVPAGKDLRVPGAFLAGRLRMPLVGRPKGTSPVFCINSCDAGESIASF